jgi:hypothetical protein
VPSIFPVMVMSAAMMDSLASRGTDRRVVDVDGAMSAGRSGSLCTAGSAAGVMIGASFLVVVGSFQIAMTKTSC